MIEELLVKNEGKTLEFKEGVHTLRLFAPNGTFDEVPFSGELTLLDMEAVKSLFHSVGREINEKKALDLRLLVEHLGTIYPSNGGIILFGTNRVCAFPDAIIRCARFRGTNKTHIFDQANFTDYPFLALDKALHFIEKNTFLHAEIGRLYRTDIPQYPPLAIREAIINALVHTDYAAMGSTIKIAIFDDRIEITNPGGLPYGITMEDALEGSSKIRNRVIARIFVELGIIEQWGSGLKKIIDACVQRGLKKPTFEEDLIEFKVTLYATPETEPILDEQQKAFLLVLKKRQRMSTKEAAEFWDIAPRSARQRLKSLIDAGLIVKVGTSAKDPQSGYMLVKDIE